MNGPAAALRFGHPLSVPSVYSALSVMLEAALRQGLARNAPILIEATCNQVNQFGGYSGLAPAGFVRFFDQIAGQIGFLRLKPPDFLRQPLSKRVI